MSLQFMTLSHPPGNENLRFLSNVGAGGGGGPCERRLAWTVSHGWLVTRRVGFNHLMALVQLLLGRVAPAPPRPPLIMEQILPGLKGVRH